MNRERSSLHLWQAGKIMELSKVFPELKNGIKKILHPIGYVLVVFPAFFIGLIKYYLGPSYLAGVFY